MTRLLRFASMVCGEDATRAIVEPLLADWHRQLEMSKMQGGVSYAAAAISGALAFTRSLITCAITDGVWLPPARGVLFSLLAIAFSIAVSVAVLLIPSLPRTERSLADPKAQAWLLVMASTILPPSFLLAMFMHRRDPGATLRHGIVGVTITAIAMIVIVTQTNPEAISRRYNTFEFQEQMRTRMIAAAKSDPDIWRGRSLERTLATTVEQRRATYERMQARLAEFRKHDPPPTWSDRFAQVQPVLLAVVFAAMGWTLGGFGRPTVSRGLIWWSLVFIATIAMTNLLSMLVGVPMPRPPHWAMLPLFTSITTALVVASTRRSSQPGEYR